MSDSRAAWGIAPARIAFAIRLARRLALSRGSEWRSPSSSGEWEVGDQPEKGIRAPDKRSTRLKADAEYQESIGEIANISLRMRRTKKAEVIKIHESREME